MISLPPHRPILSRLRALVLLVSAAALWLMLGLPGHAQTETAQEEADRGFLAGLISDNLSGVSRDVQIIGFRGALRSQATVARITVADAQGVWLVLEDLTLEWNRSALFGGRIEVEELTAGRIAVLRLPVSEDTGPTPEARPFALPELPVSIEIGTLRADRIELGAPLLGEEIAFGVAGAVSLAGGEGQANILAERLDGATGRFEIDGSYSNATRILALDVDLTEAAEGIVARLLDLPGRPSVRLTLRGNAPIDDFGADLSIATDERERIAGSFGIATVRGTGGALAETGQPIPPDRRFRLDVQGDVTPLIDSAYESFFGNDVTLAVAGTRAGDGALRLDELAIDTASLTLAGRADISAEGWPVALALQGELGADDGQPVLLPVPGGLTFVRAMTLDIGYDAATGDAWTGQFLLTELARPGLAIPFLQLSGGGVIEADQTSGLGRFTGDLAYAARGLVLENPGLAEAIGTDVEGRILLGKRRGAPFEISNLTLSGPGIEAEAEANIAGAEEGFRIRSTVNLVAGDIARFATLAGQDLRGAAGLGIVSTVEPLSGAFDIDLTGTTTDLALGIAAVDPLLRGTGRVALRAIRDETGTRVERFAVTTPAVNATGTADLTSGASAADFVLRISDAGLVQRGLSGPATLTGSAARDVEGVVTIDVDAAATGASATLAATIANAAQGGAIDAAAEAAVEDLAPYGALLGRPLQGAADLTVTGRLQPDLSLFDIVVAARTSDLGIGIAQVDPLLDGAGNLNLRIIRNGPDSFSIEDLRLATPALTAAISAELVEGAGAADLDLRLADLALMAPGQGTPGGPVTLTGTARRDTAGTVVLDLDATAPGDTTARIAATIAPPAQAYATTARIAARAASLAPWSGLAGRSLSGAVSATIDGSLLPDGSSFDLAVTAETTGLGIGIEAANRLLAGTGSLRAQVTRPETGGLLIEGLVADYPNFDLSGDLQAAGNAGQARFDARLADIGLFTPDFSGQVTATGSATRNGNGGWTLNTTATGPGGTTLAAQGAVRAGGTLDLAVTGAAPLGLVNGLIEPRRLDGTARFDLTVNGPPALSSVGGTVTVQDARLAAPTLGQALTGLGGTVTLGGAQATLALAAAVEGGGGLTVAGPIGLAAPFPADLRIGLNGVVLQDPELYETTASGTVTVAGPLAGGARIGGLIDLGPTEIQVPSSGVGALGPLPEVTHRGAGPDVARTLARAGLSLAGVDASRNGGNVRTAYPLDLTIRAPARVFIRGRGLDAELGGSLVIGGTTADVVPLGQFELLRGRLDILQQRFELTEGYAALQGEFIPFIRLVATTTARTGTSVSIVVEGPANAPEVRFESTPELPQDEVLAQLIFGRDLSSITPLQAVQLAAAVGTLAGRGGGGIIDNFREGLGLDDLDLTQDEEGNAALRAGRYLSENVYTDVTIGSAQTEINLNLDVTDNIRARGSVSTDGETSIGIFYERDY